MTDDKSSVLLLTPFLHPLIMNEFEELKNHVKNIALHEIKPAKLLLKELILGFKTILLNIKYVILFSEIIFFNLGKFPVLNLISWYLNLVYLLKIDERIHFKIIHAHWIYPSGIIASTYCKYLPKRIIMTAHGYDADQRTFDNSKLKKVVIETGSKADCIITGERRLYDNLNTCGFKKLIFIDPFVESQQNNNNDEFKTERKIHLDSFVVTFGPHVRKEYGVIDFAKAIINVATSIDNLFVICLGEGNESNSVRKLFDTHKINFEITGNLPNSKLIDYLKISDIVCNLGYISQGIFTLEAFSCGKPVIGWNDIGEIKIIDGITGFLTNSGNIAGLSEIILKLYKNPELRKKLGSNAKEHVKIRYSKNKRISTILSTYY